MELVPLACEDVNGTFLSNLVYFEITKKVTGGYIHDVVLKKLLKYYHKRRPVTGFQLV